MSSGSQHNEQERVAGICAECGADLSFDLGALQVRCDHCDAGLVVDQGQRMIRLDCPVCAGNFYYIDGSMAARCPFCEAGLLAVSRHRLLRYVVRPARDAGPPATGAELHLVPFWHISALLLGWDIGKRVIVEEDRDPYQDPQQNSPQESMVRSTIRRDSGPLRAFRGRVVDISLPDPTAQALGITSLRFRASVFPLEPFAARHEELGRVLPPALGVEQVQAQLRERALRLGDPTEGMTQLDCQRLDLVCEELALYYYPFWVAHGQGEEPARVWDGVTREPEQLGTAQPAPPGAGESGAFDQLKVLELRCDRCGEALAPGNHSMVLPCQACGAFWQVTRDGLVPFSARFARPAVEPQGGTVWLPFWRVRAELSFTGRRARRVLDLRNTLGVMRPPFPHPKEPPEAPLSYYVSAYGAMRAPRVDHAARDMTRFQPLLKAGPAVKGELYHCFFSADDARALGYTTWIQILPGVVPHRLRSLRLEQGAPRLWYVPFEDRGRELVNLVTGVRYDRSSFRGVRH